MMLVELVHRERDTVQIFGALFAVKAGRVEGVGVGADDLVRDWQEAGSALLERLLQERRKSQLTVAVQANWLIGESVR